MELVASEVWYIKEEDSRGRKVMEIIAIKVRANLIFTWL